MQSLKSNFSIPANGRRKFLKDSGFLLLGFHLLPFSGCGVDGKNMGVSRGTNPPDRSLVDAWIRMDTEGKVTVFTGKMELGQGIKTALMQMAAEELDIHMDRVSIQIADTTKTADERYTAGSGSIEGSGASIRRAAAEARHILLQKAAGKWRVPKEDLYIKNGIIYRRGNNKDTLSYWDLLKGERIQEKVTGTAPLKDPKDYQLVGKPILRDDIRKLVLGESHFIHDLRLEGMVHARILRPPVYQAKLVALEKEKAGKLPGVLEVVQNGNFVGVIAREEFQAIKALQFLKNNSKWESPPLKPDMNQLYESMISQSTDSQVVEKAGNLAGSLENADKVLEAEYKKPYYMHGSMGPSCAVAVWKEGHLTVWSPTQGVYPLRRTLSDLLGISEENIHAIGVPGSGCYGHNGADDVSADAALMAKAYPGKPVRVQWMREDEHQWEPYGSAMVFKMKAGMDSKSKITAWDTHIWSDTHSTRPGGQAGHFIAARDLEQAFSFSPGGFSGGSYRNSVPLYDFDAKQITVHNWKGPLRTSALRSLGAFANIFALESFMDELAVLSNADPAVFRLNHLSDERARAVVQKVMEKTNWEQKTKNTGKGIAFAQYKNTAAYFAVVAEVAVNPEENTFKLQKLTGCVEAGQTINSDGIKNQTEGGMIQAASWALLEAVKYDENGINSSNWGNYPILRMEELPEIEVLLIDRPDEKPLGAGEAAQGPVVAAIANAVFAATKTRIRELPIHNEKIAWG